LAAGLVVGFIVVLVSVILVAVHFGYDAKGVTRHLVWRLSERVAFNEINLQTLLAGLLVQTPGLAQPASLIFPDVVSGKYSAYVPGAFVNTGLREIFPQALQNERWASEPLEWLFFKFIADDYWRYGVSTLVTLNRGVWASAGLIGLIGLFHIPKMLQWSRIDGNYGEVRLVVIPAAITLAAHALLTANHGSLNPGLAFIYCFSLAFVVRGR
jgi:hypothetical protein